MKQILINVNDRQTRAAILENGRVTELHIETEQKAELVGNVYLGRVVDVLPSMQAAFIDIGGQKNAFLYIDDALPADWQKGKKDAPKPNIRELVRSGETLLVQINKEPVGTKAPRVTTMIGLPGRSLVYLPHGKQVSVSRKIQRDDERRRLQQITAELLQSEEGAILRTMAEGIAKEEIANELQYLRSMWQELLQKSKQEKPPCLLHQDADLITRLVRDTLSADVDELLIDEADAFKRIKKLVTLLHPKLQGSLRFYQEKLALFDRFGVDAEIDKALRRQVWLKSGGYLVIDRTEAMTVIDVNTGKYTGKSAQQLEETVTQTNLEAAAEIARQLRLRDIGGIVVIDFIDMRTKSNQSKVLAVLREELQKDRTSSFVLGMTGLGLVEMTRKKSRHSLSETLTRPCPTCEGNGRVLSEAEVALRFEREIRSYAKNSDAEAVVASLPLAVAALYPEEELERISHDLSLQIYLREAEIHPGQYQILYVGSREEARRRYKALQN